MSQVLARGRGEESQVLTRGRGEERQIIRMIKKNMNFLEHLVLIRDCPNNITISDFAKCIFLSPLLPPAPLPILNKIRQPNIFLSLQTARVTVAEFADALLQPEEGDEGGAERLASKQVDW